jgi:riboflavin kinase/FMN adenylyltransferase
VSSTRIRQAISEGYIQRANAYLDHYYIIKGKPENCGIENSLDLPSLLKVPLTEECKILPSSGIYAVSIEWGLVNSKGMVIIHGRPDKSSEVLVNIFDGMNLSSDIKITISFHKKIQGAINFSDSRAISKVNMAKEEISELIY